MRRTLFLAAAALLCAAGAASAQDKDADRDAARAVIEKAVAAHGGMDRLAKARADWVAVKGVLVIGEKETPFTGEIAVQLPGQFKSILVQTVDGQKKSVVEALDGDAAWVALDGVLQPRIPAAALAEMKAVMHVDRLVRLTPLLTDKGYGLSLLDETKVNGRDAVGVKVYAKGHREVRLYFDKEKGFLLKTEHALDDSRDKEVKQEEYYSEFKDYAGFKRPSKITVYRDGKKTMEAELVEVRYYEKIDDTVFAKP
jgi:hypothetical protein